MKRATLPGPREPALDPRTGTFSRPWILYFQQLFDRVGIVVTDLLSLEDFSGVGKQSLAANGFQKIPGGIIRQWGIATTDSAGAVEIVFPEPFPRGCFSIQCEETDANGPSGITFAHSTPTKTGTTVYSSGVGTDKAVKTFHWEAIGY